MRGMKKLLAALSVLVLLTVQLSALATPAYAGAAPVAVSADSAAAVGPAKRVCWRKILHANADEDSAPARASACGGDFKHPCGYALIPFVTGPRIHGISPVRPLSGSDGSGLLRPPIA